MNRLGYELGTLGNCGECNGAGVILGILQFQGSLKNLPMGPDGF